MAVQAQSTSSIFLFTATSSTHRGGEQERRRKAEAVDWVGRDPPTVVGRKRGREEEGEDVEAERVAMELFLRAQGEELRRRLAESGARHYRALTEAAGREAARRLGEKEAELERAARRGAELAATAARLEAEAEAWRERAGRGEAAAAEIKERLQRAAALAAAKEDGGAGDEESACGGGGRWRGGEPACRACGAARARVVALPCRHLCMCAACDARAAACPACGGAKRASVEVYLT